MKKREIKRLTESELKQIAMLLAEGKSQSDVSRILGRPSSTISYACKHKLNVVGEWQVTTTFTKNTEESTDLISMAQELREDLLNLAALVDQVIPGLQALETLAKAQQQFMAAKDRINSLVGQRDILQTRLIARAYAEPGEISLTGK